ncbi:hypothetical protein L7F22_036425 [Adiantum nelumboides]|nr:hypothetical protein [Adiantum nelumboides]
MTTKAESDAKMEIVGGYNCEEQDPKVEVLVEKEDAATSNIDHLDHIISMIAKYTMKDPPDVDTSFRAEGQVPCASNIEDQEDKNTQFFVLNIGEDTQIIIKKSEPPQENGDAFVHASGGASCASGAIGAVGAGEDTKIFIEKSKPPQENGDASLDASGDASCAGGAGGAGDDMEIIIEKSEPPQENGDASMDASCASCAVGEGCADEDIEIIIEKSEPPQENGDPSMDHLWMGSVTHDLLHTLECRCRGAAMSATPWCAEIGLSKVRFRWSVSKRDFNEDIVRKLCKEKKLEAAIGVVVCLVNYQKVGPKKSGYMECNDLRLCPASPWG